MMTVSRPWPDRQCSLTPSPHPVTETTLECSVHASTSSNLLSGRYGRGQADSSEPARCQLFPRRPDPRTQVSLKGPQRTPSWWGEHLARRALQHVWTTQTSRDRGSCLRTVAHAAGHVPADLTTLRLA